PDQPAPVRLPLPRPCRRVGLPLFLVLRLAGPPHPGGPRRPEPAERCLRNRASADCGLQSCLAEPAAGHDRRIRVPPCPDARRAAALASSAPAPGSGPRTAARGAAARRAIRQVFLAAGGK